MQVFEVLPTIETIQLTGNTIGEVVDSSKVYLFTDDHGHVIYIYTGKNASLLLAWIGKRLAKEIKKKMRGFYKIHEIEQNDQDKFMDTPIHNEGQIQELYNPNLVDQDNQQELLELSSKEPISQKSIWHTDLVFKDLNLFSEKRTAKILEELETLPPIEEKTRELIIIGKQCFTPENQLTSFLKERQFKTKIVPLGELTQGWNFFPNTTPRFIIDKGRIHAIELYSEKTPLKDEAGDLGLEVLPFERITQNRDVQNLYESFKIPTPPSFEDVLEHFRKQVSNSPNQ